MALVGCFPSFSRAFLLPSFKELVAEMKILYYAVVEMEVPSGPFVRVFHTCQELVKLGNNVTAILPKPWRRFFSSSSSSLPFPALHIPFFGFSFLRLFLYCVISVPFFLYAILKLKPTVIFEVESFNPFLVLLSRFFRIPHVVELNGFALDDLELTGANKLKLALSKTLQKFILKNADIIVGSTPGVLKKIHEVYGIPQEKMFYLDSGVNLETFSPRNKEESFKVTGLSPKYSYVTFVGTFHPHYDLEIFLKAIALLKEEFHDSVKGVLVGDGWLRLSCEKSISKLGLSDDITITGFVPHHKIPFYLTISSAGVIPMSRRKIKQQDGAFAMKLYEYLACRVPVIVTDLSDSITSDIFRDVTIMVAPGNPKEMARAIRKILLQAINIKEMKEKGIELVRNSYIWEKKITELALFLEKALKKR